MRVLAFTGMPGAGKSVAVEVANAHGIPVLRMGDFIWEEVRRRALPITSESVAEVAMQMRTDFTLVAVHASRDTRMERLLTRGREDDVRDEGGFLARDERELGWGLGRVIALADIMLVNEETKPGLHTQVERIVRKEERLHPPVKKAE